MFCNNCGAQLDEGTKFCAVCGAPVVDAAAEEPVQYAQPVQQPEQIPYAQPAAPVYEQPAYAPVAQPAAPADNPYYTPTLIFGIIAIATAVSFYLSFLGIIFGAIAKNKANAAIAANNGAPLSGKAKVGSILGKVGLILGIVLTAIFVIYLIAIIAIAANS